MDDTLKWALQGATAARFLCSGNVVRSAFAELYTRHLGCPVPVDSCGTTFQNERIFPETRAALVARGVDRAEIAAFRPRHLSRLTEGAPATMVVFGMTHEHLAAWRDFVPEHASSFLLMELLGNTSTIADPVMDGAPFDEAFQSVARCVEALTAELAGRS